MKKTFVCMTFLFSACGAPLPHEAPFDPQSPASSQARAAVVGRVELEGQTDVSGVNVELEGNGRTYQAEPANDGALLVRDVVAGEYTIRVYAPYFVGVTAAVALDLGRRFDLGTIALRLKRAEVTGNARVARLTGSHILEDGGVRVTLRQTSGPRADSTAEAGSAAALFTTYSDGGGAYRFPAVPAGTYELEVAAGPGARTVDGVRVTGDAVVVVDKIVIGDLQGTLAIDGSRTNAAGEPYLNGLAATIRIGAFGAAGMATGISPTPQAADCAWGPELPFASPTLISLPPIDGRYYVCAKLMDEFSNEGAVMMHPLVVDRTAPAPFRAQVLSENGFVTERRVTLNLIAADAGSGLAELVTATTPAGLSASVWRPFQPVLDETFLSDGVKTVWIRARDGAGNLSAPVAVTVTVDTQPPGNPGIVIEDGAGYAQSRGVALALAASGAAWMQVSESNAFGDAAWEPLQVSKLFLLSPGDGMKTVFARFKDAAGWMTAYVSDGILVDTTSPSGGTIAINMGAGYATAVTVALSLGAVNATRMQVSNHGMWDLEPIEPFSSAKNWQLTPGDGIKAVYVRYLDEAGNVSAVAAAYIFLDTVGPGTVAESLLINGGAAYTNQAGGNVTLSLAAQDATRVYLSESGCGTGGAWFSYAPSLPFVLLGYQGAHTVHAVFQDLAGNVSACISDSIALDSVLYAPDLSASLVGPEAVAGRTKSQTVTLYFANLTTDVTEWRVSNDSGFLGANWSSLNAPTAQWSLLMGDGPKTVYVQVRDAAGNSSPVLTPAVTLDQTGPAVPALASVDIDGDGQAVAFDRIELQWSIPSNGDLARFELERYVTTLEPAFTPRASFSATVDRYVDLVTGTSGYAHAYRIRSIDTLGNASAWSVIVSAQPFKPVTEISYLRGVDGYRFNVAPNKGTFSLAAVYTYNTPLANNASQPLALTQYQFNTLWQPEYRYGEKLLLRTANQDNSLVLDSTFTLPGDKREIIESSGDVGQGISVVVDRSNGVHVAYVDGTDNELVYARQTASGWSREAIYAGAVALTSIAVDADGFVHIAFGTQLFGGDIYYLTNRTGSWTSSFVANGRRPRLAVDASGNAHIAFNAGASLDLYYATNASGSFVNEVVTPNAGRYGKSILVDTSGNVNLGYHDNVAGDAVWATRLAGVWQFETIEGFGDAGAQIEIAVSREGYRYAAFFVDATDLYFAVDTGGFWATGSIYAAVDPVLTELRFVLDPYDYPHFLFGAADAELGSTYYATERGNEIVVQRVDDDWNNYFAIAASERYLHWVMFDANRADAVMMQKNLPHGNRSRVRRDLLGAGFAGTPDGDLVAAFRFAAGATEGIEIAANASGTWVTTATSYGHVAGNPVAAVDAAGTPHVYWVDDTTSPHSLMYFDGAGPAYPLDITDAWIDMPYGPHLQIAAGKASETAVAFVGAAPNFGLHVMWRMGGVWHSKLLEAGLVSSFDFYALAMGPDGSVHVAYADLDHGELVYATNEGGAWRRESLFVSPSLNDHVAIAVDGANRAHILHNDWDEGSLRYFTNASGSWVVDPLPEPREAPRIVVDSGGRVFITSVIGGTQYHYRDPFGAWTSIEVAGNIPYDYSLIVHGRSVSLGYFDYGAATLLDDVYGTVTATTVVQVQAQ